MRAVSLSLAFLVIGATGSPVAAQSARAGKPGPFRPSLSITYLDPAAGESGPATLTISRAALEACDWKFPTRFSFGHVTKRLLGYPALDLATRLDADALRRLDVALAAGTARVSVYPHRDRHLATVSVRADGRVLVKETVRLVEHETGATNRSFTAGARRSRLTRAVAPAR